MKKTIFSIALALTLTACATPYQSSGFRGGFEESQLAPNVFEISFKGNAFISRETTRDYVLLRASELTINNGYKYFSIMNADNITDVSSTASINQFTGQVTVSNMRKPQSNLMVVMENNQIKGAFDASFMMNSLKKKHKLSVN
ncbi:CC0125/CC1285 family lipoprotein [Photobacterium damselae]|uniref:CC0125/CC1285 family lipoprotein n=1 Tax=Photobacterium damselae TaxID=38293 RepID=UPI001F2D626E|nr:hypothetical protein [Photobacterium damselae]MCG3824025.1 hypothetical protein [Photobacterium damselae]UKA03603.1 hypothetical protein IHC89_19835 [Photobacterium damselae subsp. damselae]